MQESPCKRKLTLEGNSERCALPTGHYSVELKAAHDIVRSLIHHGESSSSVPGVVRIPTGGQVNNSVCFNVIINNNNNNNCIQQHITLVQVSGCRVSSSQASVSTAKRRAESMESKGALLVEVTAVPSLLSRSTNSPNL